MNRGIGATECIAGGATAEDLSSVRPVAAFSKQSSFDANSTNLDFIRAVAVLCVFTGHLHGIVTGRNSELAWHFAQIGVLIFFVHTSMVLMLSLERSAGPGPPSVLKFYLRRFFRIYPLSMACVTIAFLLGVSPTLLHPQRHWTLLEYLSNLALTTNMTFTDNMVGGLWTLPIEVQMYVVLPFLFAFARKRSVVSLVVFLLFIIPLAMIQPQHFSRLSVVGYAPCFIAGVIAWRGSRTCLRRVNGWFWPITLAAICPIFLYASREYNLYYRWTFCIVLGAAIPWFREVRCRPLERVFQVVAKYSYGIYLSHFGIMLFAFRLPVSPQERWLVFITLAVLCPVLIYHAIEYPFNQLGRKVAGLRLGYQHPFRIGPNQIASTP